jgi:hypothetical protein
MAVEGYALRNTSTNVSRQPTAVRALHLARSIRRRCNIATMPTHEPEMSEAYYGGDFYEGSYGGESGANVQYFYVEDDGYSYDPDAPGEPEWLTQPVLSGPDVNWSDDASKRKLGEAILSHYFRRASTSDELDLFMEEIAPSLEDGIPFAIGVGTLDDAGLSH